MPKMDAYERYRLRWMLDHDHSLTELVEALRDLQYGDPEDGDSAVTPVDELFDQWQLDIGFAGGEIRACRAEWEENEGLRA